MKAMILAAGEGTRLRPFTYKRPKPMFPLMDKPVLEHIVNYLKRYGFDDLAMNLNYYPEMIEEYFKDGLEQGVKIRYSVEKTLLGTAGGVKKLEEFFDSTFAVIGGDDITDVDLGKVLDFHRQHKALATIAIIPVKDTSHYGVVVTDEAGRIVSFQEKPKAQEAKSNLANTGIYLFEPEIFQYIPAGGAYDFGKQLFPELVKRGLPFYAKKVEGYWSDIGNLKEYRKTCFDALNGKIGLSRPAGEIRPGVWAGANCLISPQAELIPPVLLGDNCRIEAHTRLEGPVQIGGDCGIFSGCRIKNAVIWDGVEIGGEVRIKDCILGSNISLPHALENHIIYEL